MENSEIEKWTCDNYGFESNVQMIKSVPDIRLTELEQQLEVAESRCGSLKSQLDYMKMLYQGVQPSSAEFIQTVEEPKNSTESTPRETEVKKLVEDLENTTSATEDVKYYQFLNKINEMQEITRTDIEKTSPRQYSGSPQITPRLVERQCAALEEERESISAECRHTKRIHRTYRASESTAEVTPESSTILKSVTAATASLQIPESCKEYDVDDATPLLCFTDYSAPLQNDLPSPRKLTGRITFDNRSECDGNMFVEQKKQIKKHELVLKLSESMDGSAIAIKRKKITKVEKKQKSGLGAGTVVKKTLNSKYDDTLSVTSNNKNKRKKGKLRNANSKNTVTTKETNLTDRRDSKKRKQKGFSSATHMPRRFQPTSMQRVPGIRAAEVVEIYHNNAVEGGSGTISNSSSKHEAPNQRSNNQILSTNDYPVQMCADVTYQQKQNLVSDQKPFKEDTDSRVNTFLQNNGDGFQKYSSQSQKSENCGIQNSNRGETQCRSAPTHRYYDISITRNYELPTVASKLKKVNRSYFNRFNFRNIPFVVSTSVTPSHNLGLNIQQVLSIMKTRQPMMTGMTPLLIRKMSKGIKQSSVFLDPINNPSYNPKSPKSRILGRQDNLVSCGRPNTSILEYASSIDGTTKSKFQRCSLTSQTARSQFISSTQTNCDERTSWNQLADEDEVISAETNCVRQQESGCICCSKKSKSYNKMLKEYTSRKSMTGDPKLTASALLRKRQEELNIGDNQYNQTGNVQSGNAKGIREVLINLHDQFQELNTAYEKLQEDATNSNDKSITKQAAALEKELNAKEAEINAVVGLYKEVLHLKQQVHSIHGKNSFVCVTTSEINPSCPAMIPRTGNNMQTQLMINPMQILGMRNKGKSLINARELGTSTRLTGLLREIQSFQKQLLNL